MTVLRVEIVTPVHNRREETLQCLRSISRLDTDRLDLHVIIVDDGSTDGTSQAVSQEFPEVEIVSGDGSLWYTAGTNRGIERALRHDPDYILAINNDSIFDEKCVRNMIACAEKHPKSVVGALLLNWQTPHRVFQVAPRWEFWRGGYRHWFRQTVWTIPKRPWAVDLIVGNCVLYPTAAVREAGLMDEKNLFQYGDAEYTPRMRRLGWRLLMEPRARVFCKPNDPASGFRQLPVAKKLSEIFQNPASPYSLKRRLFTSLGGAPNRILGVLAVAVYYARVATGRNQEGIWALEQEEEPLSKTFASAVVDE